MKVPHEIVEQLEFLVDTHLVEERETILRVCTIEGFDEDLSSMLLAMLRAGWVKGLFLGLQNPNIVLHQLQEIGINVEDVPS